jgi:hypothetical protein
MGSLLGILRAFLRGHVGYGCKIAVRNAGTINERDISINLFAFPLCKLRRIRKKSWKSEFLAQPIQNAGKIHYNRVSSEFAGLGRRVGEQAAE